MSKGMGRAMGMKLAGGAVAAFLALGGGAMAQVSDETNSTTLRPTSDVLISEQQRVITNLYLGQVFQRTRAFALRRDRARLPQTAGLFEQTGSGLAGGGHSGGITLFASLSYNDSEDDFVTTAYDSDTQSLALGGDYMVNDKLIAGVSLGFNRTDTSSTFNGGGSDVDGWNLSPYASLTVNDWLSLDLSVGYSSSESDNRRVAAGANITGTQESDSRFGAISANASHWMGDILLAGNAGYIYSRTTNDSYTESNGAAVASSRSTFKQIAIGGQVSYYTDTAMPYLKASWQKEVDKQKFIVAPGQAQPSNDDDEFVVGIGVSLFGEGALSGGLDLSTVLGRDNFDSTTLSASISYAF